MEWVDLSGRATLYTYTIVRHPTIPALAESVPYVIAIVKLPDAGDVKLITNIIDCDVESLEIGQELEVVWSDDNGGAAAPRFRPVAR